MSDQEKLGLLLDSSPTNLRPSLLLAQMKDFSKDLRLSDAVLRQIFIKRMPKSFQPALLVSGDDIDKLAEVADKLTDQNKGEIFSAADQISKLQDQVEALIGQLKQLQTRSGTPRRGRSRSRGPFGFRNRRFRSNSQSYVRQEYYCWYHFMFGERAHKCRPPCSY